MSKILKDTVRLSETLSAFLKRSSESANVTAEAKDLTKSYTRVAHLFQLDIDREAATLIPALAALIENTTDPEILEYLELALGHAYVRFANDVARHASYGKFEPTGCDERSELDDVH